MKAAFYGKSKLYCSVACQSGIKKSTHQQQTTGGTKRTYDSMSHVVSNNNIETISASTSVQQQHEKPNISLTTATSLSTASTNTQHQLPPTPITPSVKVQKINQINQQQNLQSPITPVAHNSSTNSFFNQITTPQQPVTTVVKSPSTNVVSSFSWPYYIEYEHENAEAAPVYAFKHVSSQVT